MMNDNVFNGFSPQASFRIIAALSGQQLTKLPELSARKWTVTKVYFSRNACQCALVLKQPGAVGILYPNGNFHRPGGAAKKISLDADLLEKDNTPAKAVA